jgi:hypothetical protein
MSHNPGDSPSAPPARGNSRGQGSPLVRESFLARSIPLADRLLFYVLLALLCARPMIGENYERLEVSFLADLPTSGGPTPATTAWLDTFTLATAVLTLARGGRWRGGAFIMTAVGLLAAAVVASTYAAGNHYLAWFAGSSLLIGVLAAVALGTLVQARWMWHVLIAAALATGGTTAVKCIRQSTLEFAELRQSWEQEYKPALIQRGYNPDDPLFVNYERRMQSREAYGFLSHPNVTGSCLMMWLLVLAGVLAASGLRPTTAHTRTLASIAAGLGCVLLAIALGCTRSRGALVSGLLGLGALALLGAAAAWVARRARLVLVVLAGGYLAVVGSVAAYGVSTGTLPHPSLAFRWYYWTAAARAYRDAPLTGIGRENFATAYMLYKAPESTEEVKDPHSVWVSLLVELGPLGLAGGALLCGLGVLGGLRRLGAQTAVQQPADEPSPAFGDRLRAAAPIAGGVLLVHLLFSGTLTSQPATWFVWAADVAFTWVVAFVLALWVLGCIGSDGHRNRWVFAGLCAALLASLVHNLLDFALMTPGGLAFGLCAAAARGRSAAAGPSRTSRTMRLVGYAVVPAALLWHPLTVALPVQWSTSRVQTLHALLHSSALEQAPQTIYAQAAGLAAERFGDPSAHRYAVRAMLQLCRLPTLNEHTRQEWLTGTRQAALDLTRRHLDDSGNFSVRALVENDLADLEEQRHDPAAARQMRLAAAESWDQAVARYPTNPRTRISAGNVWFEIWQRTEAVAAAEHASAHFAEALHIDDLRPPYEVVRLQAKERERVATCLAQLQARRAVSTNPASAPGP